MPKETFNPATKEEMFKALQASIQMLSARVNGIVTFNEIMDVKLLRCDPVERSAEFQFCPKEWMVNPTGTLHGGIFASVFDYCMGVLTSCYANCVMTPAVSIDVRYLIPGPVDSKLIVRTVLVHRGRVLSAATAEIFAEDRTERILATASGSYYAAV